MSNRLSIPECLLLVMQRVTKYPLLLDSIAKTTDSKAALMLYDVCYVPPYGRGRKAVLQSVHLSVCLIH